MDDITASNGRWKRLGWRDRNALLRGHSLRGLGRGSLYGILAGFTMDLVAWTVVATTSDAVLVTVLPLFLVGGILGGLSGQLYATFARKPTFHLWSAFGLLTTAPVLLLGVALSVGLGVDNLSQ